MVPYENTSRKIVRNTFTTERTIDILLVTGQRKTQKNLSYFNILISLLTGFLKVPSESKLGCRKTLELSVHLKLLSDWLCDEYL